MIKRDPSFLFLDHYNTEGGAQTVSLEVSLEVWWPDSAELIREARRQRIEQLDRASESYEV